MQDSLDHAKHAAAEPIRTKSLSASPLGVPRVMCPDCGAWMRFRLLTPHPNRSRRAETSTFECACGYVYEQTVGRTRLLTV